MRKSVIIVFIILFFWLAPSTFAQVAGGPTISSISPTAGYAGRIVAVYGSGFTSTGNTVNFGSTPVLANTCVIFCDLSFTIPPSASPGIYALSVTNSNGTSNTTNFRVYSTTSDTSDSSSTIRINESILPNAVVGTEYSATLTAGGTIPGNNTWFIESGNLPPGLNLSPSPTANSIIIRGTPTSLGTYPFTIQINSGNFPSAYVGTSKQFTLIVNSSGPADSNLPYLIVSDRFMEFNYTAGDNTIRDYTAHLSNSSSTQPLTFTISIPNQPSWLNGSYNTAPLSLDPLQTSGIGVGIDPNVPVGSYSTVIIFTGNFSNSPASISIKLNISPSSPSQIARHPRATLVVDSSGTVYFLGAVVRYPFPSAAVFLSWGNKFSDIVPVNSADLAMPVGPVAQMKQ